MDPVQFDPSDFSGRVPLFPLPNAVLFPHGLLPLHIFEERYREMTRAALAGERLIAMALLKPGWEEQYLANPPIHEIVGVGKVVQDSKLKDGKYNLLLFGVARARVVEVLSDQPYRTARVELLPERPAGAKKYERKRKLLLTFLTQVLDELLKQGAARPPTDMPLGALCDLLASMISLETPTKQSLLEELDVAARCDRLLGLLSTPAAEESRRFRWPPEGSLN